MSEKSVDASSAFERIQMQGRNLAAKYRQTMENYERNTGHKHPLGANEEEKANGAKEEAQKEVPLQFPEKSDL
ncbi:hypothetical protein Malapachy_3055 [Malassezia pachydermatis]|uniref:Uncharacterized protein n=1 Tax=Malassezia pachydermatis TaxID=77020 RepID=A0A0M9VQX7_9BASI|nr:hypothetical protein Malapachy_3055 [Malassezia pachydermatis]KOS16042.1 hypothetical protein Malapachy_3055 [Malassezia pachydermatis]